MTNLRLIYALIVFQVLDGILTYIGVEWKFKTINAEGNPVIKYAMELFGTGPSLIIAKTLAVFALLYLAQQKSIGLSQHVLIFLNTVYAIVIVQWVYALLFLPGCI